MYIYGSGNGLGSVNGKVPLQTLCVWRLNEILIILRKERLMFLQIVKLYTSHFYLEQIILYVVTYVWRFKAES